MGIRGRSSATAGASAAMELRARQHNRWGPERRRSGPRVASMFGAVGSGGSGLHPDRPLVPYTGHLVRPAQNGLDRAEHQQADSDHRPSTFLSSDFFYN